MTMALQWKIPDGPIKVHCPKDRAEWLELRSHDVTASTAGALLGVHEYTTAYELWAIKSGLLDKYMAEDDPVLVRGELLEDDAIELLRRRNPQWRILHNVIGAGGLYFGDSQNRMGGTPDGFCIDDDKAPSVIEIKTTDYGTFRDKWQGPDGPEPPLWIAVQAMLDAYLANARRAYIVCMVVGRTLDLHVMPLAVNPAVIKRLQEATRDFWVHVDLHQPPNPDFEIDGATISALLPRDNGAHVDLSHDNEFCSACGELIELRASIAALKAKLGRHEALIKHRMGHNATATAGQYRVSHKLQYRKAHSVAATEFRKLTVSEPKERT